MKIFSKRLALIYLIVGLIAAGGATLLMSYWYQSILTLHKQRLIDTVGSRKSGMINFYEHKLNDDKAGASEAFRDAVSNVRSSFVYLTKSRINGEFVLAVRENGILFSIYKNINGQPFTLMEPLADQSDDSPISMAMHGHSGFLEHENDYDVDVYTAYDYADLGEKRVVLIASVPRSEVTYPRRAAVMSAIAICFIMFSSGGIIFLAHSRSNLRQLKAMNREREAFGYIMNSAKELISYINTDGVYLAVNDAYEDLFGVPKEQIIGMSMQDFHGAYRFEKHLQVCIESAKSGESAKTQFWYELMGGRRLFLDISFVPHYIDGSLNGIVVTANDITELENAKLMLLEKTRDLQRLTIELEDQVKSETEKRLRHEQLFFEQKKFADMGQMINAIAHQWRQPINALGLYIQYIVDSSHDESITEEMLKEFKSDSINLVQHLSKTIDDFRCFFEPSKSRTEFQIIQAVTETVSLVDAQLKNHFIDYTISCKCKYKDFVRCNAPEHPACDYPMTLVSGYPSEFKQVLMNIIQNAKDALNDKKGTKELAVDINATDEKVIVTICDNGGGIPEDVIGQIFDPYFTTKMEGKGTGIGLYMSRLIIEGHMGGRLSAFNKAKGACFEIMLDRLIPEAASERPS